MAKEKIKKKTRVKISLRNIIIFFVGVLLLLYIVIFYNYFLNKNEVYAKETSIEPQNADVKISNANKIDVSEMIEKNVGTKQDEYITEQTELEYMTQYNENPDLPKGTIQVIQEGREGTQEITTKKVYENGEVVSEEQVGAKVTKAAVNKIVEIGTGSKKTSYKVQAGDKVYITSDRAEIMVEPNVDSTKVATLSKGTALTVLSVQGDWYQVNGQGSTGYIKIENTTYINQNESYEEENNSNNSDNSSITPLSFDMSLNKPSGLTLDQFKKVLSDSKDKNKIFEKNAEYFYYIEKQYNINGVFVAAVGIHESSWGTSKIALQKHNLFGYGAYDSNPYNGAYNFTDYSECIDLIARVFVKYYINPAGTSIYDGEKASGKYYNGPTLSGVNKKYATDKNWANGVYEQMKYLYNKL